MPSPDFTQVFAQLWPQSGMSKTAFLGQLRSQGIAIRTQNYYRIVNAISDDLASYEYEFGKPLNVVPTEGDILPLPRARFKGFLQHVHLLEMIPTGDGNYIATPLRWSIKTNELMSREDALQTAYSQASANEANYGVEGSFLAPGFYIGTWEGEALPQ